MRGGKDKGAAKCHAWNFRMSFGLIAIHFPDKEKARHTDDCEPWVVLGGRELICFLGFHAVLTPGSDGSAVM